MKLETTRLILREFDLPDAPFILRLFNTPGWLKYIGDRKVYSLEDAASYLENRIMASYQKHGFGMYAMIEKNTETTIGMCGIVKRDGLDHPDFGFALLPEYMRQAFTYEAAMKILEYAATQTALSHLYAITLPENIASCRLLEKLKFVYTKDMLLPDDKESLRLYGLELNSTLFL